MHSAFLRKFLFYVDRRQVIIIPLPVQLRALLQQRPDIGGLELQCELRMAGLCLAYVILPAASKLRDEGQGSSFFHLLEQLAACVVEGEHAQVGGVLLRPGLTRYVAQKLQEQTTAAAGGIALAAAGSDCFREAAAVSSLLEAVLEPFATFRACGDFLRAQEAQTIADKLPEQAFIIACVGQSVLHGWRHGLLPGRIACGERLADGGGAGERAADFRGVVAGVLTVHVKRLDVIAVADDGLRIAQRKNIVWRAERLIELFAVGSEKLLPG